VAKRKADGYGPETLWYKIKIAAYTQGQGGGNCSRSGESRCIAPYAGQESREMLPGSPDHTVITVRGTLLLSSCASARSLPPQKANKSYTDAARHFCGQPAEIPVSTCLFSLDA
jgi:hypothetical protein